ncbi:MAG: hypothetical protein ACK4L4_09330 [Gemmobacter sp.]
MRALLSRLSARDWLIVIAGLAVVLGIEMAKPLAPAAAVPDPEPLQVAAPSGPPVFYPEAARRLVRDVAGLSARQRGKLDEAMAEAPYFTAFAAGPEGAYGWARGYSTRSAARVAALTACSRGGAACRLVAEVVPQAMPEAGSAAGENSLSFDQAEAFRRIERALGPRTFVRSLDGAWATGRAATVDAAVADAVLRCEGVRKVHDDLPPMPCEAIAVWENDLLPPR